MDDREWTTGNYAGGEPGGEKKDGFFQKEDGWWEEKASEEGRAGGNGSADNPFPDGRQSAGQDGSGYEGESGAQRNSAPYQGENPYQNAGDQNGGRYRNSAPYQNAGQYQNNGQYQNSGPYQNGNSGSFPHSPYQGAPLRPDGRLDGPEEPIKVSEWLLTMLVLAIPCVNLIMLFVWGFGGTEKRSKSNYCKAYLIWMAISFAVAVLFYIVVIAGIVAGMS